MRLDTVEINDETDSSHWHIRHLVLFHHSTKIIGYHGQTTPYIETQKKLEYPCNENEQRMLAFVFTAFYYSPIIKPFNVPNFINTCKNNINPLARIMQSLAADRRSHGSFVPFNNILEAILQEFHRSQNKKDIVDSIYRAVLIHPSGSIVTFRGAVNNGLYKGF
jgi:hypothetical protein